jgi:hypothetical protein
MDVRVRSVEEMRLVNLLRHLVQYAEDRAVNGRGPTASTTSAAVIDGGSTLSTPYS